MRIFLLPLLTGCLFGADPTGIWEFYFPYQEDSETCTDSTDENFSDGVVPSEDGGPVDSDWNYEEEYTGSDTFLFAQMTTTTPDNAMLVMGSVAYPGTRDGKVWTFEWTDASTTYDSDEHDSGYRFTTTTETESSTTIVLTMAGDEAEGEVEGSGRASTAYTESDQWNAEVEDELGGYGQIPSSTYLVDTSTNDNDPQLNYVDEEDCNDDPCKITLTTTCSGSDTFTATRTDLSDEDAYHYMMSAGQ